jgi:alpha-glucuronidase
MKFNKAFLSLVLVLCFSSRALPDNGYNLWLKYPMVRDAVRLEHYRKAISCVFVPGKGPTCDIVRGELQKGLSGLLGQKVPGVNSLKAGAVVAALPDGSRLVKKAVPAKVLKRLGKEGFTIRWAGKPQKRFLLIAANTDKGLLYGAFHLLRLLQTGQGLAKIRVVERPRVQYRLLNHWDNLDGSVERGYAGKSLWKWRSLPDKPGPRVRDYARANASIGINGAVLNNVDADPAILKKQYLVKVAALADIFRSFGIRTFLSVNFASPLSGKSDTRRKMGGIGNLLTADPLDPGVRKWWKEKVNEIYGLIPDFGGFLVKANSEGMPGPQDYQRTHAHGANMLAEALAPHKGVVIWRAFVYDMDIDPDRAKCMYKEFTPLNGKFRPNVFVQSKNGPMDFQPREPVQPLFGAMSRTPLMVEFQITQEYLGQSTHLVFLAPLWKEFLDFDTHAKGRGSLVSKVIDGTLHRYAMTGMAGVANTGDSRNWCGHFFAQANWYAFGRLAWNHRLAAEKIADEWVRMSLCQNDHVVRRIAGMMMGSREACVNYMTPLGLHHIMKDSTHYGPDPGQTKPEQPDSGQIKLEGPGWTSVYHHRADSAGLGFDRRPSGSNAVGQYFRPVAKRFGNIDKCPEKFLLWFHHAPWGRNMKSGLTLWDELCRKYAQGVAYVDTMTAAWAGFEADLDQEVFLHVKGKLEQQKQDAKTWQETCLGYFKLFSKREIQAEYR